MMIQIRFDDVNHYDAARAHLDEAPERVCFFLATWDPEKRELRIRTWRSADVLETIQPNEFHVALSDALRGDIIQWAATNDACLVEAHSHGKWSPAEFSAFDLRSFEDWVPHLWWRLQGRPYAAIVTSTSDLDALAWINDPRAPEQVKGLMAGTFVPSTGATLGNKVERNAHGRRPV